MRSPNKNTVESTRRSVELMLSIVLLGLTVVWSAEPAVVFGADTNLDRLWIWAAMLVPGLLSLSLLARCLRYGWEGFRDLIGKPAYPEAASFSLNGIIISLFVGIIASYTLWWSLASLYVFAVLEAGGVILGPVFAIILGTLLAAFVLVRTAFYRLLTDDQQTWLQGPMAKRDDE